MKKETNKVEKSEKAAFIQFLLNGPVLSEKEIKVIQETHKDISKWRSKKNK